MGPSMAIWTESGLNARRILPTPFPGKGASRMEG